MTGRIFLKLIGGVLCVLLLALVTVDYFASEAAKSAHLANLESQLAEKCRLLAISMEQPGMLEQGRVRELAHAGGGRITVVAPDGRVLVDSDADAGAMENHRTRPELLEALAGRAGHAIRQSATIGEPFLYFAAPSPRGAIRIAVPLARVNRQVNEIRWKILVSTALAFLPAIAVAALLARFLSLRLARIMAHTGELARGNFRARLAGAGSSEFGQLERTLNETAANLQSTVEQLERDHAELEKLERIRRDFVINVSHELRTPLASIQGYTETLIDGALYDADHNLRFLGIIRHNAERLARLTADLLALSRVEQGRQRFEFETHVVNDLLDDALQLMTPIAGKKGIVLASESAPAGVTACCDSEAVSQVLGNLLDNAIKHTPRGGRITVGVRPSGSYVEVWVRDTGIGIPPEDLPRLFERFYRVDKARSREMGGTGLGLAIVKHLVIAHNGSIRVESEPGNGSTFFFTLPGDEAALGPASTPLHREFTPS
jgi:two-component system, OmpR family, phosphate regulon sensor histidine kinase PhoR